MDLLIIEAAIGFVYKCVAEPWNLLHLWPNTTNTGSNFTEDKHKDYVCKYFYKETTPKFLFLCAGLDSLAAPSSVAGWWNMFVFNVFKMATGIGTAALPRTMMSQSLRSPSGSLWPSLTTILCPCPPTQTQLTRSCPSKRGRSLGWELRRLWCTAFLIVLSSSVHLFAFKVNTNYKILVVCWLLVMDKHYNPEILGVKKGYFRVQ